MVRTRSRRGPGVDFEAVGRYEKLPDERPWNDTCWIFAFLLVFLCGFGLCIRYMGSDILQVGDGVPSVGDILAAGFAGGIASLLTTSAYM